MMHPARGFMAGVVAGAVVMSALVVLFGRLGLVYDWIFRHVASRPTVWLGVVLGAAQAVVVGLALGFVPALGRVEAPGFFLARLGVGGVLVEVLVQVAYGAIVAVFDGNVRDEPPAPPSAAARRAA